ncbi:hypothetical protein SFRURICE_013587, partial [Spodoptera frugiperda]
EAGMTMPALETNEYVIISVRLCEFKSCPLRFKNTLRSFIPEEILTLLSYTGHNSRRGNRTRNPLLGSHTCDHLTNEQRHAFYPRRDRQRCTLLHVIPLCNVNPLFTIYVQFMLSPIYRATTEKFSEIRKKPVIFSRLGNRTQDPLSGSRSCNHQRFIKS